MFSRVRIAIRFFFMGLAVGVLLAPRSGKETRRMVRERADRLLNDLLDAATLGAFDSGADGADADEPGTTEPGRTTNGRTRKSSSSSTATSAASGAA
jgi:gas vesicle protein